MVKFNRYGFLEPSGAIAISLTDFKKHFVFVSDSETRIHNFEKYASYSNQLKKLLGLPNLKQWINGSFVTSIKNPKDIDLVTFIDFELRISFANQLKAFEAAQANAIYGVDAYLLTVFPPHHPKAFLFESDQAYWMEHFSKSRRNSRTGKKLPKGYLEIIY